MKRIPLALSSALVVLCLLVAASALFVNGLGRSHAARTGTQVVAPVHSLHAPTIVLGMVYYGIDGKVAYALNAATGKVIWQYAAGGLINANSLSIVKQIIYFATNNDTYALQAANGKQLWQFHAGSLWSPTVADGLVHLSSGSGAVALDATTGALRWHFSSSVYVVPGQIVHGTAYFIADGKVVYAVNDTTGTPLWHHWVGRPGSIKAIANGVIYIVLANSYPQQDGAIYALRVGDGTLLWKYAMRGTRTGNGQSYLQIINGEAYVVADIGHGGFYLTVLDESTGIVIWPRGTTYYVVSFEVVNGAVYLSDGAGIYNIDSRTGHQFWHYQPNPPSGVGSIVVANTVVYAVSNYSTGPTVALNAANGTVLWSYQPQDAGVYLTVANTVVYLAGNYHVYALNGSSGSVLWTRAFTMSRKSGIIAAPLVANGIVYVNTTTALYALNANDGTALWHYQQ